MLDKNDFDECKIETITKKENGRVVIASIDDKPIGHISYSLGFEGNENEISIETMGVADIHERRGIARLMLEYIIENYGDFTIQSGASNEPAKLLQESVGFITTEPYRLRRDSNKKDVNRNLKNINPQPIIHKLPKVIIPIYSVDDLEIIYQRSKNNMELFRRRSEVILSYALDEVNGYKKANYSSLYNMIEVFIKDKNVESTMQTDIEEVLKTRR